MFTVSRVLKHGMGMQEAFTVKYMHWVDLLIMGKDSENQIGKEHLWVLLDR